ncbi:MAG: TIGR02302 family protein [Hyphomicrobiales bacterium]|nr:TIGR02302 family protein [Hyphomicrobiales bacterium]
MRPVSYIDRLIALSRATLAWESVWRAGSGVAAVAALFLAVSWFGLWTFVPPIARILGAALFLLAAAAILVREIRRADVSREAAARRIDRRSGDPGQILATLRDTPANAATDPATAALWRVHLARLEARLRGLSVGAPSPQATAEDRWALRAGAVLLAVVAAIAAGPDRSARLAAAFDWRNAAATAAAARLDAWIDPPAYTGRAPIVLTGRADRDALRVSAPMGSIVIVRAADAASLNVSTEGALVAAAEKQDKPQTSGAEKRFALKGASRLTVGADTFEITAIPDSPPTIELLEQPRNNLRGSMTLSYKLDDDYGVIAAEARVTSPEIEGRPARGRPLTPPPNLTLTLPPAPNGLGEGRSTLDVSESPWAGARVSLTLNARDEGGNESSTPPISIYLPQRNFTKPLARALVEQRRNLVLEPDNRARVGAALEALMQEPEKFGTGAGIFLGLSAASSELASAKTDNDLTDVADLLWSMALQIEDGGLSNAERDLRAAEKQLRDALRRNAPEEEIRKLTEALRQAMDKFLAEMMQQQKDGKRDQAQSAPSPNSRTITPEDLRNMLDDLDRSARSGDMAQAQRLLDQMQDMLENLRTARRGGRPNEAQRRMNEALGDMDKLMRDQQQLRDDTYRDGRGKQDRQSERDGATGKGQKREGQPGSLRDRQSQLRDRLAEIERKLGPQGGEGQSDLKSAEEAMRQADGELGEGGDRDKAVDAQGRALEAMKKGADRLARQMQNNGAPSDQMGENEGPAGDEPDGQTPEEADPLGRPRGRDPRYNPRAKYDPLGASPALRAQRVLEELRRRLGDVSRPQEELDYLERLIKRY